MTTWRIDVGDTRELLRAMPDASVDCVVTSPPYWGLRDYGVEGQIGLEETAEAFVESIAAVFDDVRRVLRAEGTLWLNLGDSYAGSWGAQSRPQTSDKNDVRSTLGGASMLSHRQMAAAPKASGTGSLKRTPGLKAKDLVGIPWRVAFALQAAGWWLRSDIIWSKPNPMPESVADRPTRAHEYVFLLTKSATYFYDADAVRSPLREKTRTTWGTSRRSKGTDALGAVKSDNFARSVPERRPRLNNAGEEAGANLRSVWHLSSRPFDGAHFATFPPELAELCIAAGSPGGGRRA